jgi:hypothetical protein
MYYLSKGIISIWLVTILIGFTSRLDTLKTASFKDSISSTLCMPKTGHRYQLFVIDAWYFPALYHSLPHGIAERSTGTLTVEHCTVSLQLHYLLFSVNCYTMKVFFATPRRRYEKHESFPVMELFVLTSAPYKVRYCLLSYRLNRRTNFLYCPIFTS